MSNVKTRKEINAEKEELASEIERMKAGHSETVATLESKIADLTAEVEQAKVALVEADEKIKAKEGEVAELTAKVEEGRNLLNDSEIAKDKAESELKNAKAALADPALVDATMVETKFDQKLEDADADKAEANANKKDEDLKTITEEAFRNLSPEAKNAHYRQGGKVKFD